MTARFYPLFFAPDRDQDWTISPGIVSAMGNLWPTKRGTYKGCDATGSGAGFGQASTTTYGTPLVGRVVEGHTGTMYPIIGTTKRLLKLSGGTYTFSDISKGATDYTTAADWVITSFGSDIIALSKANAPQVSSAGGTFADITGSPPKAACGCVQKDFLILGDTNDGVDDFGDRVWWSGLGNYATWTPDIGTEAGNMRLRDTPGPIISIVPMQDFVIAYKANSMYVGTYVGIANNIVWSWNCVSHNVGCASRHGVAQFANEHIFIHKSNVYRFDGTTLTPVGDDVIKYLIAKAVVSSLPVVSTDHASVDDVEGLVLWHRKATASGTAAFSHALSYNVFTGRFGWIDLPTSDSSTVTGAWSGRVDVLTAATTSSIGTKLTCAMVGYSGTTMDVAYGIGESATSTHAIDLGYIGDDTYLSKMSGLIPRLSPGDSPTYSNTVVYEYKRRSEAFTNSVTFSFDSSMLKLDGEIVGQWLKPTFTMTNAEIVGVTLVTEPESEA